MYHRLLGGLLMVALGIAYMTFGNAIVDPSSKALAADKQDWVSKSTLGVQVCYYHMLPG